MKIGGFQKTSLLDYPQEISCIIWTVGCNFNCPFCYNKSLVEKKIKTVPEKEIMDFLKKRKNMIKAVVISGGEPFLQKDLFDFVSKVKKIGYLIKIDTNGMYPEKLQELLDKKLVDYIAMDIKAPKKKYNKLSGLKTDIKKIEKSIKIIQNSGLDYEFKTTFVPDLLSKKDIIDIAKWIKGSKKYYLQQFKNDTEIISSDLLNVKKHPEELFYEIKEEIKSFFDICDVRGL